MVVYRGEFDPHGQVLLETGSLTVNNKKFTGYERDATGLDFAQARMYNHNRGRFMQADPGWLSAASARKPQTLNRYSYVNNDPVNLVDRTGLNAEYPGGGVCFRFHYFNPGTEEGFWGAWTCFGGGGSGNSSGGSGGDVIGGGSGDQWPEVPLPNDLKDRMKGKLKKRSGRKGKSCEDFIKGLMAATGRESYGDLSNLIDKVNIGVSDKGYNTVTGSFATNDATILLELKRSQSGNQGMYDATLNDYAASGIHELVHLAAKEGQFSDLDLARAVSRLNVFNPDDEAELRAIEKETDPEKQLNRASAFWDGYLQKYCN